MPKQLPTSPPWNLIAKKNTGVATPAELDTIAQWLAQNAPPVAEALGQIDITFADEATMTAWLRMQQRSKRMATNSANWLVAYKNTLLPITAAEVVHFTSCPGHVALTTLSGQTYALALTLNELETTADAHLFFRANQSALVARAGIAQTSPLPDGSLRVQLKPTAPQEIVIPPTRTAAFNAWFCAV